MQRRDTECLSVPCDATIYSQMNEAARYIEEYYGKIDMLINCTANGVVGGIHDTSKNDWDEKILGELYPAYFYDSGICENHS